jgi:hypothetical protein
LPECKNLYKHLSSQISFTLFFFLSLTLVMVAPVLIWAGVVLAGSSLFFHTFVKPRLPVYNIQIHSLPRLRWMDGQLKTQLPTRVTLRNDNYVPLDIHAIHFDLFYTDYTWNRGQLQHLATVQDRNQQQAPEPERCAAHTPATTSSSCTFACASAETTDMPCSTTTTTTTKLPPVWQIQPRSDFDFKDDMYLMISSPWSLAASVIDFVQQFVTHRGLLVLPSTGVAHIHSRGIPVTVSMICDNVVHVWSMRVEGLECTLENVQTGWVSLPEVAASMRRKMTQTMRAYPATGGVYLQARTEDDANKDGGGFVSAQANLQNENVWHKLERTLRRQEAIAAM